MQSLPTWQDRLARRGVLGPALAAGWHPGRDGWEIPITDPLSGAVGRRWKAYDSSAKPKALWLAGDTKTTPYYAPQARESLTAAIAQAGGVVRFVEGEIDMFTLQSLGFQNVLSPSSGVKMPLLERLAADLLDLGVKRVLQYCDNDPAGLEFAAKIGHALEGSGITHDPRIMRAPWGELPKDTNDLWQLLEFDAAAMLEALEKAPAAVLPPVAPKPEKPAKRPTTAQDGTFKEQVRAALNPLAVYGRYTALDEQHGAKVIAKGCCPFHTEKTPSFVVYEDGGATCYGACGQSWDIFEVVMRAENISFPAALELLAGLAGIERPAPSTTAQGVELDAAPDGMLRNAKVSHAHAHDENLIKPDISRTHAHAKALRHFAGGIPARLITVFLNLRRDGWLGDHTPAIAAYMALHELIASGDLGEYDAFGALELETSPRQLSEKTALKGLRQLEKAGFLEAAGSHPAGKGKPRQLWTLKPLKEALAAFQARRALVYREQEFSGIIPDTITPAFYPDLEEAAALEAAQVENELRAPLYAACADKIEQANERINKTLEREERAFNWRGVQMEAGEWSNGVAFRRAFALHQAVYRMEQGKTIARRFAAKELGVKPDTLYDIRRRVGIATDAEYKESAYSTAALEKLPESHLIEVVTPQGSMTASAGRDTVSAFAAQAMSKGESVTIRVRTASRERYQSNEEKAAIAAALEAKRQQKPAKALPAVKQSSAAQRTPAQDELSDYHSPRYIAVQFALTPLQKDLAPESVLYDFVREIHYSPENGAKSENAVIPLSSAFFAFPDATPAPHIDEPAPDTNPEQIFVQSESAPKVPTPVQLLEAALEFGLTWENAGFTQRSRIYERANEIRTGIDRAGSLVWARQHARPGVLEGVA